MLILYVYVAVNLANIRNFSAFTQIKLSIVENLKQVRKFA